NHDKRFIFINPYEGDKALIGTTDIAYEGRAFRFVQMEVVFGAAIEDIVRRFGPLRGDEIARLGLIELSAEMPPETFHASRSGNH
ncbi:hypothetical protein AB9F39_37105, partial [Rhizobium leguminosarum]